MANSLGSYLQYSITPSLHCSNVVRIKGPDGIS